MTETKLISSRDYGYIESDWLDFLDQIKRKQDGIPKDNLEKIVKGISMINKAMAELRELSIKSDINKLKESLNNDVFSEFQ